VPGLRAAPAASCLLPLACNRLPARPALPRAALVSRQFVDMSRIRIEGLLAAFPKLVGTGKQHTYVETENVRYLYQPIEVRADQRLAAAHEGGVPRGRQRSCRAAYRRRVHGCAACASRFGHS